MNVQTQQTKTKMTTNTPTTILIENCIEDDRWCTISAPDFQSIASYTLDLCKWNLNIVINLILTNDKEIQELNFEHRSKNSPTNVLSFQAYDEDFLKIFPKDHPIPLGDIVMAFETIDKEAKESHKLFINHYIHLFLHGLLHLLGYDHMNDEEANQMEQLEIQILNHFNIPNPYEVIEHL